VSFLNDSSKINKLVLELKLGNTKIKFRGVFASNKFAAVPQKQQHNFVGSILILP